MKFRAAFLLSLAITAPLFGQTDKKELPVADSDRPLVAPIPAAESQPRPKLDLVSDAVTQNYLAKFAGTTATDLTNSVISENTGLVTVGGGPGHVKILGPWRRMIFSYDQIPGTGADLTGQMGTTETLAIGWNSEGMFYGTPATASGRMMYFYDYVASKYRGAIDGAGTWWIGSSTTNFGLKVQAPGTSTTGMIIDSSGNVGIGGLPIDVTPPAVYKLKVYGAARFDGPVIGTNIQAHYQDFAEWVLATTDLAPGTVVILNRERNNEVMASATAYDTGVAGVVSSQPGILLGVAGESKEQIATTGRVRVRVDATQGPIRVGDLLVTSGKPGMAMRSEPMDINGRKFHQPGTIIGKALEPLASGEGEILVLLSMQ